MHAIRGFNVNVFDAAKIFGFREINDRDIPTPTINAQILFHIIVCARNSFSRCCCWSSKIITQMFDWPSVQKRILITKNSRRQEPGLYNKTF